MTKHLILLGDSIFDNGVYVELGQDDVTAHLERKLVSLDWTLDMRAVDGSVVSDVVNQLSHKPISPPCTFVLSVGGNDALGHLEGILSLGLTDFYEIKEGFRKRYTGVLDAILNYGQPLIVCTIYNPNILEPEIQKLAEAGLSFFNDVITEESLRRKLPIIDLREVCSAPEAFANPIEPSEIGGDLISDAIIAKLPN